MNTADIMQLALEMAGMDSIPADSGTFRPWDSVKRILLGIDNEKEVLVGSAPSGQGSPGKSLRVGPVAHGMGFHVLPEKPELEVPVR